MAQLTPLTAQPDGWGQNKAEILDETGMARAIARIAYEIIERNKGTERLCIIGILTRGKVIAQRISEKIAEVEQVTLPIGCLDITRFRDDLPGAGAADGSRIDFSIERMRVILVDDVIYTGRTARAAIDALMRRGRPQSIQLAALIDRGHREIPIRPDFIGKNLPTSRSETVRVMVGEIDGENRVVIASV